MNDSRGGGVSIVFGEYVLALFMLSRPTKICSHWWEFVYTECHHDFIMTLRHSNGPACCHFSRRRIFVLVVYL